MSKFYFWGLYIRTSGSRFYFLASVAHRRLGVKAYIHPLIQTMLIEKLTGP